MPCSEWCERLQDAEQYGYDRPATECQFGAPSDSRHKIVINCRCGKTATLTAGNFYWKQISLQKPYRCKRCGCLKREADAYTIDWVERCSKLPGYDVAKTKERFGYEYPSRSTDFVCVRCVCEGCTEVSEQPVLEFTRKETTYRCKRCMSKAEFPRRQAAMHKNLKEFWSKEENREWASRTALSQHDRRSANMTKLNQSAEFQEKRVEGYNNSPFKADSKGEAEIREFVMLIEPSAVKKVFGVNGYHRNLLIGSNGTTVEIDVFVPEKGVGFEHNGVYWHSSSREDKPKHPNAHYNKWLFFNVFHNVRVLQIWESEWASRKPQVKNKIRAILGLTPTVLADACELVPMTDADDFLEQHHISGSGLYDYALGLKHQGSVVAVATFSGNTLLRYTCGELTVVGGLTRLAAATKSPVETFCDLRWSRGLGLLRAGWEVLAQTPPAVMYINSNTFKMLREEPTTKTNWHKHYDCGQIKFRFSL